MSIFDTDRMGWIWGSVSVDAEPVYFEAIWKDQPAHTDELDPVPGSIILILESSRWKPAKHTDSAGSTVEFPINTAGGYPEMLNFDEGSPGPQYFYNGWGPGTYTFYCGFVDWSGNPGPLIESGGDPMQITIGEGEVRGNVLIRPYSHGEEWGFSKDAKGIMIYVKKDDGEIYPIGLIDFLLGWRKVGDIDCELSSGLQNAQESVLFASPLPFRYCAGDNDDEEVPGLLSLTGSVGLGSGGTISWDWEDYVGPVDADGNMLYTFQQGEGAGVDTMSISPADFKNMMYSRGFNNRSAHRDTKPFKYFSWPPNSSFEEVTSTRIEDVGKQWRWTCATQSKGYAYIGNVAHCESNNTIFNDEEEGVVNENAGIIRNTYEDRVMKSGYRQWNSFNPKDYIDIIVNDGDEIIALETYQDRILVFRNRSVSVLNTSEGFERLEDTFPHGIDQECNICSTPHGVAFISNDSVYLYNGNNLQNLSSRSFTFKRIFEQYSSNDPDYGFPGFLRNRYENENRLSRYYAQSIGYAPKGDKLIILMNVQATNINFGITSRYENQGFITLHDSEDVIVDASNAMDILTNDALMYNFKTKNWSYLKDKVPGKGPKSNFVNINNDLVYYNPENGLLYKWDDDVGWEEGDSGHGDSTYTTDWTKAFSYITPYFDFGQKNVKKRLKTVYITLRAKHRITGLQVCYVRDNKVDWSKSNEDGSQITNDIIDESNGLVDHFRFGLPGVFDDGGNIIGSNHIWMNANGGSYQSDEEYFTTTIEFKPKEGRKEFYNLSLVLFACNATNGAITNFSNVSDNLEILDISVTYREKAIR